MRMSILLYDGFTTRPYSDGQGGAKCRTLNLSPLLPLAPTIPSQELHLVVVVPPAAVAVVGTAHQQAGRQGQSPVIAVSKGESG
jgi:hypothetical protein